MQTVYTAQYKKINKQIKKWEEDLTGQFSRKTYRWPKGIFKDYQYGS